MADKRITNLPVLSNPTLNDEMHINDVLSNFDKKILLSVLRELLSVPYMQVSISNYDNDSAPAVKQGSSFDNKGIPIDIASDLTPTGYGTISVSTTFYLYWDESASAFIYSETVPTWTDLYQGWYNVDDRALFSMFKDSGGTLYEDKNLLITQNNLQLTGNLVAETLKGPQIAKRSYVWDSTDTEASVYTALASYLPDDKYVIVSGQWNVSSSINRIIKVTASSKLTIRVNVNDGAKDIRSGNGTAIGTDGVISF